MVLFTLFWIEFGSQAQHFLAPLMPIATLWGHHGSHKVDKVKGSQSTFLTTPRADCYLWTIMEATKSKQMEASTHVFLDTSQTDSYFMGSSGKQHKQYNGHAKNDFC